MLLRTFALGVCALGSILPSAAAAADFGIADVWKMIERADLRKVEQVIRRLPDEMRANYVLMADSKSSHQASAQRPRVIMMSRDARLLAAFSSEPNDPAYNVFELIEFKDESDSFEFREITFARDAGRPPKLSIANPVGCADCHTKSLRPNWAPGVHWSGAIGTHATNTHHEMLLTKALVKVPDPRYAALHRIDQLANSREHQQSFAARMSKQINALNNRRIARWIYESPDYEQHKYTVVAALVNSPRLMEMVSAPVFSEWTVAARASRIKASLTPTGWWTSIDADSRGIAQLQLLFEGREIEMAGLSTSFDNPNFLTANSLSDFNAILTRLYEIDPRLAETAPLPKGWQDPAQRKPDQAVWNEFVLKLLQKNSETQLAPQHAEKTTERTSES